MFLFDDDLVEEREISDHPMIMNIEDIDQYCNRSLDRAAVSDEVFLKAPFNDTCLQEFFYALHMSLRRYSEWEEVVYTTIYIIISVLAVIGNGLVILAVIRKKAMRTNRNVLIVNLAISNLMLAFTVLPFLWLPSIDFEFPYSRFFCKFANALPGSNIYCSTLTISVMAIDRYYSVKKLSLASERRQCVRAIMVSVCIWILSFFLSLPLLVYYDTAMLYVFKNVNVYDADNTTHIRSYGWRQCRIAPTRGGETVSTSAQSIQLLMSVLQVLFLYVIPLIVLSIFNVKLTRFLKTNAKQMSRNRGQNSNQQRTSAAGCETPSSVINYRRTNTDLSPAVTHNNGLSTPNSTHLHSGTPTIPTPRSHSPVSNQVSVASPAERASARRRSRTTALLVAMAGSYAALWLPFTLVSVLIDMDILFYESHAAIIERIDQSCKVVSLLSICVNPFLYGFLNTNFRHEFADIYRTWLRCRPALRGSNFAHEFSSVAYAVRQHSIVSEKESVMSSIRRSFRGSFQRMRPSMRAESRTQSFRSNGTPSHRPSRRSSNNNNGVRRTLTPCSPVDLHPAHEEQLVDESKESQSPELDNVSVV